MKWIPTGTIETMFHEYYVEHIGSIKCTKEEAKFGEQSYTVKTTFHKHIDEYYEKMNTQVTRKENN